MWLALFLRVLALFLLASVRCDQTAFLAEYEVDTVAFQHETILQRFSVVSISVFFEPGKCVLLSYGSNPHNKNSRMWCPAKGLDLPINHDQGGMETAGHPLAGVFRLVCGVDVWESHHTMWWRDAQNSTETDWAWPHQMYFLSNQSLPAHPALAFAALKRSHTNRVVVRLAIVLHEGEFVGKRGVTPLANVLLRPRTLRHLRKQQCSLQILAPPSQSIRPVRRLSIGHQHPFHGNASLAPSDHERSRTADTPAHHRQWLRRIQRLKEWVARRRSRAQPLPAAYKDIFADMKSTFAFSSACASRRICLRGCIANLQRQIRTIVVPSV